MGMMGARRKLARKKKISMRKESQLTTESSRKTRHINTEMKSLPEKTATPPQPFGMILRSAKKTIKTYEDVRCRKKLITEVMVMKKNKTVKVTIPKRFRGMDHPRKQMLSTKIYNTRSQKTKEKPCIKPVNITLTKVSTKFKQIRKKDDKIPASHSFTTRTKSKQQTPDIQISKRITRSSAKTKQGSKKELSRTKKSIKTCLTGRKKSKTAEKDDYALDDVDGKDWSFRILNSASEENIRRANFPFLKDPKTIAYIKSSHTMFILRGPSGCGKSTIVELLRQKYCNVVVCSADHYFTNEDGSCWFEPSFLPNAHQDSQNKAENACINKHPVIVIDNTNIKYWEMKPYLNLAKYHNYTVIPVYPQTEWSNDPDVLAARSQHGVSVDKIEMQLQNMEDLVPLYYGWFLSRNMSEWLANLGKTYLQTCVDVCPEFCRRWFLEENSDPSVEEICRYFRIDSERVHTLHCTAKFCGSWNRPAPNNMDYHLSDIVQKSCGQVFGLAITGFTISPRTFAARVKLMPSQLMIFDRPEERARYEERNYLENIGTNNIANSSTLSNTSVQLYNQNYPGKGQCAHITLATASGIYPVQSNFDILDVCERESNMSTKAEIFQQKVKGGLMKVFGEDYCAVYLKKTIQVTGLFSGYYN